MSRPAARVGDMHVCPMFDGPKPHVGGPVLPPGEPTVLIGGAPAARVGDLATCASAPDTIATGAVSVLIGGAPAARLADTTVHGGSITAGCPTVLIGDAAASATVAPRVTVVGTDSFVRDTVAVFDQLKSTPTGKRLLEEIAATKKHVTVVQFQIENGVCIAADPLAASRDDNGKRGPGSDSTILFNPRFSSNEYPLEAILGHEMIHALHFARGELVDTMDLDSKGNFVMSEELRTVGIPPYEDEEISENRIRQELRDQGRTDAPYRSEY